MARALTTQDISWFLDLHEKGQLDLNPPYQRKSVWSPRDRRYFVDTILNNYPAPPVFLHKSLNENGRATYHVVDGKQRLQTIIDFAANQVRIPDDFADVTLQRKKWSNLERETRERFWNYVLIVEMLPDTGDAALRNTFERINRNSRKLTEQEMRHARYDGWLISKAESEAEKQEWKDFGVVTPARTKRMADVQFISELFYVTLKNKITGFDQDGLNEFYAEYEDISEVPELVEDDFVTQLESTKNYVRDLIGISTEIKDFIKVQSHFYTLWSYLNLEKGRLLAVDEFAEKYSEFLRQVQDFNPAETQPEAGDITANRYRQLVSDYALAAKGASTDFTPRNTRQISLTNVIHGEEHQGGNNAVVTDAVADEDN